MSRPIAVLDRPTPWTTLEQSIEQELMLVVCDDEPAEPEPRDWYQDRAAYSLPKECMPQWRTVH